MSDFTVDPLLATPTVTVRDVCRGQCRHRSAEECAAATQLAFPYRGVFVRHVGSQQTVAMPGQVMFFNADEGYSVSHPVAGGDASLGLTVDAAVLDELAPGELFTGAAGSRFRLPALRIDARALALVALLRHSLREHIAEPLEAESLALTLARRALGPRTTHAAAGSRGRQRLVGRAKLVLADDLSRRWTLSDVAAEVGVSPVYLTQVFQQVEGLPLYRYQLRLRLARALDLLGQYEDVGALGLDLGFSSHSHFSAAFQQTYGRSPSEFRASAVHR